jgi:membrane-bound ClpP family serine protease
LQAHLNAVLNELQQVQMGRERRQKLISEFQNIDKAKPRRLLAYIANISNPNSAIQPAHIVPFADALSGFGQAENLDLMIHTMGGSGDTAEKIVEMCRKHCAGEFRVIIPNMAKSAGTLIALGADKIVMGHCSEAGPIDPQIRQSVGNSLQNISAWTFIHTRDELQEKVNEAIAKGQDPSAYLQQLASIDPVFVKHCEQLMEFAEKVGRRWITGRLVKRNIAEDDAQQKAHDVIDFLSDVAQHISHGKLILAGELRAKCGETLDIEELEETQPAWQLLWELYVRCEVFLMFPNPGMPPVPKAVLFETSEVSLTLNG